MNIKNVKRVKKYKDSKCCLEYISVKDDLIEHTRL